MTGQPDRVAPSPEHQFSGAEIDRGQPLEFMVNGTIVSAFAGDTVLTALLAAGRIASGTRNGSPLALDERFAPAIVPARLRYRPEAVLPMERTPAVAGMEFLTVPAPRAAAGGKLAAIGRLVLGPERSLGMVLDRTHAMATSWRDLAPERTEEADLAIVGGGISGLAAAIAAGRMGARVVLVERRNWLGGDARYFGHIDGEMSAELALARLAASLATLTNVTIMRASEAISLAEGRLRVHQVTLDEGRPTGRTLDIVAPRVLLATGTVERLPVFSGNRLPGVIASATAFHRANRYGVWHGQTLVLNAASSVAYRLATRAIDVGASVQRLTDCREQPQSRFIEFAKAYGITLSRGVTPIEARPRPARPFARRGLTIRLAEHFGRDSRTMTFDTDQFVVSGGWQPEIGLWLAAGGGAVWVPESATIAAGPGPDGVALAGSAAGFETLSGCVESAEAAVATLFGRVASPVEERRIDLVFETPDAPATVAPGQAGSHPAYLDGGPSLNPMPQAAPWRLVDLIGRRRTTPPAEKMHAMSLGELAAAVGAGIVEERDVAALAEERCLIGLGTLTAPPEVQPPRAAPPAGRVPPWLEGRFGEEAEIRRLEAAEGWSLEPGVLLQSNFDAANPRGAMGVVLGDGLALLDGAVQEGATLVLRTGGASVTVRVGRKFTPEAGDDEEKDRL